MVGTFRALETLASSPPKPREHPGWSTPEFAVRLDHGETYHGETHHGETSPKLGLPKRPARPHCLWSRLQLLLSFGLLSNLDWPEVEVLPTPALFASYITGADECRLYSWSPF
jgi:hypothetical protein